MLILLMTMLLELALTPFTMAGALLVLVPDQQRCGVLHCFPLAAEVRLHQQSSDAADALALTGAGTCSTPQTRLVCTCEPAWPRQSSPCATTALLTRHSGLIFAWQRDSLSR